MTHIEEALKEIETAANYLKRAANRLDGSQPDPQTALKDLDGAVANIAFARCSIANAQAEPTR